MVSTKSIFFAAIMASAVVAAPAPAPAPAPVELSTSLENRGLGDVLGSLVNIVGSVVGLLTGSLDSVTKPDSPAAAAVLAETFVKLGKGLDDLLDALKSLPLLGAPVVGLLAPILLSPFVSALVATLEAILVVLVDNVDRALLGPVLAALPALLGSVDKVSATLGTDAPALSGQLLTLSGLVGDITQILKNLGVSL